MFVFHCENEIQDFSRRSKIEMKFIGEYIMSFFEKLENKLFESQQVLASCCSRFWKDFENEGRFFDLWMWNVIKNYLAAVSCAGQEGGVWWAGSAQYNE